MAYKTLVTTSIVLSATFSLTSAANCNTAQFRKDGDPSGQKISDALRGTNGATLNSVCNGGFPPGSDTIATFNTGSLIYNITRADPNKPIENCDDGFQNIIQQCIVDSSYWGGDWELDGITYAIYDQSWPDHILPSELQSSISVGTKTASSDTATTPGSTSATMETATSTMTSRATPGGQTVIVATINGSPVTETFVPTTVSGITAATTTSTTIDGVIVPLILGPLGIGFIPFIPPGGVPPVPDFTPPPAPGDGGNDPSPTVTKSASQTSSQASSSSTSSASSRGPISQDLDDGYNVGTCGRDGGAAGRTTTFKTSGSTSKPTTSTSTTVRSTTIPKVTPSSTTTTATAVFPSSTGINCGQSPSGGTRLADCLNALSSVLIPNDSSQICTNTDKCINGGQSVGGDPLVTTSNFCTVGGNGDCSVVIANKLSSFGFPGFSCVTGADLNIFIKNAANQCNNGLDAYAIAQGPNQYDSLCLTSADDPGLCGA